MTCQRLKRLLRRVAMGVAALPVLWVLIVMLLPTDWARTRLISAVQEATGRSVRLDHLALGPLGGLHLKGFELSQSGEEGRPWLTVEKVVIRPDYSQLFSGWIEALDVHASGIVLRAERKDGQPYPFHDLLRRRHKPGKPSTNPAEDDEREVRFRVDDVKVSLLDEPTGTHLEFSKVAGHGVWRPHRAHLDRLAGSLNGGTFEIEGEIERTEYAPMFEVQTRTRHVAVGQGMGLLAYLVPVLAGTQQELEGQMDLDLYVRGVGDGKESLGSTLVGQGTIVLDPIELNESELLDEVSRVLRFAKRVKVASIRGNFGIAQGRVLTNDLTLEAGGTPIVLAGSTDFRGRLDYRVRCDAVKDLLAPVLAELPLQLDDVVNLRIQGTPGHLTANVEGIPLRDSQGKPLSDREAMRELGRRVRDRLLR